MDSSIERALLRAENKPMAAHMLRLLKENDGHGDPAKNPTVTAEDTLNPLQEERMTAVKTTAHPNRFHAVLNHENDGWFIWDNDQLEVFMWCFSGEHAKEEAAALNAEAGGAG